MQQQYTELDGLIRQVLWCRALRKGGQDLADAALARRDAFVQVCLLAQRPDSKAGPPDVDQSLKVCIAELLGCKHALKLYTALLSCFECAYSFKV